MTLETPRLVLRELCQEDFDDLFEILGDPVVMTAYEHAFDHGETQAWLDKQLHRYRQDGFGLWAAVFKGTGHFAGQVGLTLQDIGEAAPVVEVGYLFKRRFWHQGFAIESAKACKKYAFDALGCEAVYSIIRDTNEASRKLAERNGMVPVKQIIKHYYNMEMPHHVYRITREEYVLQNEDFYDAQERSSGGRHAPPRRQSEETV